MATRAGATIGAALSLVAIGVLAAGSSAAVNKVETDVEITNGGSTEFEGSVSSKKRACETDRKVLLFRLGEARRGEQVGKTRTTERGRWTVEGDFPDGDYKARVPETKSGSVICLKGASQTLPAG